MVETRDLITDSDAYFKLKMTEEKRGYSKKNMEEFTAWTKVNTAII